jgi:metallo-beta-lactamase class B
MKIRAALEGSRTRRLKSREADMKIVFLPALLAAAVLTRPQDARAQNENWTRAFAPFKLIGNIYWVGSYDLSTYLITTPEGHILINTGIGDTARQINASVEQLGFKMADVKILTSTHGHFDHVAGMADLKKMTGASLMVSEPDKELLESGGKADFRFGDMAGVWFEPAKVDRTFRDGEVIALGGTTLTAHLHSGHTKGATSFTTEVRENGRTYRVIIANMGSINPGVTVTGMPKYPGITKDYARTFAAQKDMKIDVWFSSHASQFRMHEKYKPGDPYDPDRFVDPAGFLEAVRRLENAFLAQVARERAGKKP